MRATYTSTGGMARYEHGQSEIDSKVAVWGVIFPLVTCPLAIGICLCTRALTVLFSETASLSLLSLIRCSLLLSTLVLTRISSFIVRIFV